MRISAFLVVAVLSGCAGQAPRHAIIDEPGLAESAAVTKLDRQAAMTTMRDGDMYGMLVYFEDDRPSEDTQRSDLHPRVHTVPTDDGLAYWYRDIGQKDAQCLSVQRPLLPGYVMGSICRYGATAPPIPTETADRLVRNIRAR